MPSQSSSTAQDLARGKRSEIDYLNGLIVKRGEALGIATPANRVLCALVKLMGGNARRAIEEQRYVRTRIRELSALLD